ncbi:Aste57867_18442 [Aphanomyces stellatus]|uniref:Aste57867_18442 protein n=1 Tax=Aphanomyces stellatus TaxID=120398 RepID=A0A485LAP0_9STRA|nr:hypothetical protein As57867_018380 [Aphanomyces stellatus]VFT95178.1 Aste57867_18442 [Aphanomyces stellatus]
MQLLTTLVAFAATFASVDAVGRMISPPHRGYMGRLPQFKDIVPIDWTDNVINGGGQGVTKNGLWGVCGDKYTDAQPRAHEDGGLYGLFPSLGSQVIAGCYAPGATIPIQVQLTANHKGYFTFAVCKLNGKKDMETEACFTNMTQPDGTQNWPVPEGNIVFTVPYVLPVGLTCEGDSHCVLRWWYIAGNSPGTSFLDEQLIWNCADIYISSNCGGPFPPASTPIGPTTPTPVVPTTPTPVAPTTPTPAVTPTPTTAAPVTTRPTIAPVTSAPATTTPSPNDPCNGNHNTCYWALTGQTLPYTQDVCLSFGSFIWCN